MSHEGATAWAAGQRLPANNACALFMRLARELAKNVGKASEIAHERWRLASKGYAPGVIDPYPLSKARLTALNVERDYQMAFGALADDLVTYGGKDRESADAELLARLPDATASVF